MTDDRAPFREAREAGLTKRNEAREARAIRKAEEGLIKEAKTFAQAIDSDLGEWTNEECRKFLRQFAAECQTLIREIGATP